MKTIGYYIQNTPELDEVLETIRDKFISFIDRDFIEMNYSEVRITARYEDIPSIEKLLAPLV